MTDTGILQSNTSDLGGSLTGSATPNRVCRGLSRSGVFCYMENDMPILRIKKRDNPFVQIDKRPINDERLSWKAKGILVYLLSKPDDWKVWIKDLVKRAHDGKASVRSGIQELMDAGYVARHQGRTEDNRWGEVEYTVREVPLTGFQQAGNQEPGNRDAENRTHTKNDLTNTDLSENEVKDCPANAGGEQQPSKPIDIILAADPPVWVKPEKPPAVKRYRVNTNLWPRKPLWKEIDEIVGHNEDDLLFWGQVVHAYVGLGWNPKNVSGMLEFYQRREIPSTKPKRARPTRQALDPQTFITGKYQDSIRR